MCSSDLKQTLAPALDVGQAGPTLVRALNFLGQGVPAELAAAPPGAVWAWALAHWSFAAIPRRPSIPLAILP